MTPSEPAATELVSAMNERHADEFNRHGASVGEQYAEMRDLAMSIARESARLRAAREGMEADARRYRFWCEQRAGWISSYAVAHWPVGHKWGSVSTKERMDFALDKALSAAEKQS